MRAENQRQSSQKKNSSSTNYCLTVKNNLTEHWYIQVSHASSNYPRLNNLGKITLEFSLLTKTIVVIFKCRPNTLHNFIQQHTYKLNSMLFNLSIIESTKVEPDEI